MAWLFVPDSLVRVFPKLLISLDFHAEFYRMMRGEKTCEWQFCSKKKPHLIGESDQRRMARNVRVDRKGRVTQIPTVYNHGEQISISEYTTHQTSRGVGYNSGRSHQVPLLTAKKRNLRLQTRPQWRGEHWKKSMILQYWSSTDIEILFCTWTGMTQAIPVPIPIDITEAVLDHIEE